MEDVLQGAFKESVRVVESVSSYKTYAGLVAINAIVLACALLIPGIKSTDPFYGDYRGYYSAGQQARLSPGSIYNWDAQVAAQRAAFGNSKFLAFIHPPLELLLFAPLSKLPYSESLNLWRAINLALLLLSAWMISVATKTDFKTVALITASLYPVFVSLLIGQDGILILLLVAASFQLLRQNSDFAAGLVLSLVVSIKPQLPLVLAIALFAIGRKRFVASFMVCSAVVTLASLAYMGRVGVRDVMVSAQRAEQTGNIAMMPTIRGVVARFAADPQALSLAVFLLLLGVFFVLWRRSHSLDFAFSTAICVSGCAAIHVFPYDLPVFAIPIVLLLKAPKPSDARLLALLCSAPLYITLSYFHLESLFVLPTLFLCVACFRLSAAASLPSPLNARSSVNAG